MLGEATLPVPSRKIALSPRGVWQSMGARSLPRTSALFRATGALKPTARPDLSERAFFLTVPFQATVKSLSVERPGMGAHLGVIYALTTDSLGRRG